MSEGEVKRSGGSMRIIGIILVIAAAVGAWKVFGPNTGAMPQGPYLYVHTGDNYDKLLQRLKDGGYISDAWSFDILAKAGKLPGHIHPGKYYINKAMSNYHLVRMLHAGRQTPVRLVINRLRTRQDLVNLISNNLEADSARLKHMVHDPVYLAQFGLDTNTVMCAIMPDTYDFYWNTGADKAFRKIEKGYAHFWDDAHKQQAKSHGLTPVQAIIIASIVDEETNKTDEKPNIASVYINRVNKGMKLQADPTVKFAVGDFTIRRIAGAMMDTESPYNTYKYAGLPPGPICTPSLSSIQAVLDAPKTTYLYFCAKEDFSGYHNFATTYADQEKNAQAYRKALDARNIH